MRNSPLFWFAGGVVAVYAYHKWVKPLPASNKAS